MAYYVLYNPLAGNGKAKEEAERVAKGLAEKALFRDMTEKEGEREFFASLTAEDTLILCGGDGTLNRFINETDGGELPCEILYCAAGSGNDFLSDIGGVRGGEPVSIKKYLSDLPTVEVNGEQRRFLNNVGFGIDGYCCEVGDAEKAKGVAAVNYTAIAIKGLLFHYKPTAATVTVDGREYRYDKVWLAPTMKGRYYGGGMIPTPDQDRAAEDGTLSVMIFHGTSALRTLMIFPSIFKGEHVKHTAAVTVHTGKEIRVTFDRPAPLQIDGETVSGVTSYRATAKCPAKLP